MKFIFCIYFVALFISVTSLKFENKTGEIFPQGNIGIIAAFTHFNSDEYTDVVTLQQGGHTLQLFKGSENQPYFQPSWNCSFSHIITSVVPGDYNGDLELDLLITFSKYNNEGIEVMILWGSNDSISCNSSVSMTLLTQPFVVDFNGDMIPDIIGDDVNDQKRHVWISSIDKKFSKRKLKNVTQNMRKTHSSGIIDLNNDMAPDILITGEEHIEVWINSGKDFVLNQTEIPYPRDVLHWQSTFVDLNLDGKINHVMPICKDDKCGKSEILIWNEIHTKWETLLDDFKNPNDQTMWGFKLPVEPDELVMAALPVTLRAGDVDMDGYPDFITVLQSKKDATDVQAVILRNIPCKNCTESGRTLKIVWDVPGLKDIKDVQIAAFFDLFEDGTLDILASTNTKQDWEIYALKNTEILDSCFLKVLVLSGLNCANGTNQPGPIVRYNMTTQDGKPLVSTSVQLSQTSHFPLQLPYSLFGLGQTPNFIDVLSVSIPASFSKNVHKREWVQIIPNSQIVIIPHPPNEEKKWVKRLFITPSHLVVLTCIALAGTCIFLCLLVALLQWKEWREDKKEKMQDAYRFHFDAM